jgi:hypothetical protein
MKVINPMTFPNDENGNILRRMYEKGDDLTQSRMIDFCFAFPERQQALAFAETVDDRNLEVCISYYDEREMWQVVVKRHMIPIHSEISALESTLASNAEHVGGEGDGWGCMLIKKK